MSARAVVVAHRETMVAEGIAAALTRYPEIVPVGVATSASEGEQQASRADAVAIDQRLPGAEQVARRLRKRGVRVVLVGDDGDDEDGIRVAAGASIASLASALVPGLEPIVEQSRLLSPREREVLNLVARGFAAKEIARLLDISVKTVERHKGRIYAKLGVTNQAAAVFTAMDLMPRRRQLWSRSTT